VRGQAARFNATTVLIEDKSSGTELIQELHSGGDSEHRFCSP